MTSLNLIMHLTSPKCENLCQPQSDQDIAMIHEATRMMTRLDFLFAGAMHALRADFVAGHCFGRHCHCDGPSPDQIALKHV